MRPEAAKAISPNFRRLEDGPDGPGWYMFIEGERVITPQGTGFVVLPLLRLEAGGNGHCHVQLDGHEAEDALLVPCSIDNLMGLHAVSLE